MSHRHLFDVPDDVAYFNCAYYSPLLNESRRRLTAAIAEKAHPWTRTTDSFFDDIETLRELAAQLFGGSAEGYALVPSVSYGISAAARVIEPTLQSGDRILVMQDEFPSNVLPWRRAAAETGADIVTVPTPDDGNWTAAVLSMIDPRVKVLAMSACHWTNGAFIDLGPISRAARDNGSALIVDATQSLGAMPFSMDEIRPDFLVAGAYKWLLCPYGTAIMHVSETWRNARPLEESWLARANARDFTSLADYSDEYLPGARRFDVGEKATAQVPGALAALEQIQAWGIDAIASHLSAINTRIATRLETLGFRLAPAAHRCPHMFGARVPERFASAEQVAASLRARQVYISRRGQSLRFAPHMHVNEHDIARLLDAVTELQG